MKRKVVNCFIWDIIIELLTLYSFRFGLVQSTTPSHEEAKKKKARLARFAPGSKADPLEEDKRKARAIRLVNTFITDCKRLRRW